jgi:hypothetical protein
MDFYNRDLTLCNPVVTIYHQFNIQQFYALPTECIYVFCMDLKKRAIVSLYSIN